MIAAERTRDLPMGAATREAYGSTLVALGAENPNIVVLDADLSKSTMTGRFGEKFPGRFFNVGAAEQNLIGVAAGLASCGKIPFASSFAVFAPGRCFDQLRIVVAQPKANVKLVASHAGLTTGADGKSAQALEDVALMRALHGFVVLIPSDETSAAWATRAAAEHVGPVYVRVGRAKAPRIYEAGQEFQIGKAVEVLSGRDVTIIANGVMVGSAIQAAGTLSAEGVEARVLDLHTVAPIDAAAISRAAAETGALVVAETVPVPIEFVAARDYGISGEPDELLAHYGLTASDVASAARRAMNRRDNRPSGG